MKNKNKLRQVGFDNLLRILWYVQFQWQQIWDLTVLLCQWFWISSYAQWLFRHVF